MIDRRRAIGSALAILPLTALRWPALAQSTTVPVRLGYLWIGAAGSDGPVFRGILKGLEEVGLVEGQNLLIEKRYALGQRELLPSLARELVDLKVAAILVAGSVASKAVHGVTTTVPIISTSVDPVGLGLAASLARPGGNVTGMTVVASNRFAGKWVQLLKEIEPRLSRAAFLVNGQSDATPTLIASARAVASELGIDIVAVPLGPDGDVKECFDRIEQARVNGLMVSDDALLLSLHRAIVAATGVLKLPAVYGHRQFAEAGGLMSYASDITDTWRRAGGYVDKILKGARPGDLPIEQPVKIELVINMKAAKLFDLGIPLLLLARADEVIE